MLQSTYLPRTPHHLDYKYKKVVYVEYTDESFTKRKNPDNSLVGPLLKGKINDQLHVSESFFRTESGNLIVLHEKYDQTASRKKFKTDLNICHALLPLLIFH